MNFVIVEGRDTASAIYMSDVGHADLPTIEVNI